MVFKVYSYPFPRPGTSFVHKLKSAEATKNPKNRVISKNTAAVFARILTPTGAFPQDVRSAKSCWKAEKPSRRPGAAIKK